MNCPTVDALRLAAEWLRCYEGEDAAQCIAVANWLDDRADENELRRACRQAGLPIRDVRAALRGILQTPQSGKE